MSTDADRAASVEEQAHVDATADLEATHANAQAQPREDAHVPAPAPQQPDYTSAPQDPHERAPEILSFSDPEPPEAESNPMAAVRDALMGYKTERDRERAADESKVLPAETSRRWHKAHKDSDRQTPPRRKRGSAPAGGGEQEEVG